MACPMSRCPAPGQLQVFTPNCRPFPQASTMPGVISSPSIVAWSEDTVKVAYSVQGSGLRLTTAQLAVVQS